MLCRIELSADALLNNFRIFKEITQASNSTIVPVLKSNAYGHGLKEVYSVLAAEHPTWISVNYVTEAAELRQLGFTGRILVVGPAVARELATAAQLDLDMVIGNMPLIDAWIKTAKRCRIHVKVDTGMSRQGFLPEEIDAVISKLVSHSLSADGVCTHFANVEDVTDQNYALHQLRAFETAAAQFSAAGMTLIRHAASSASSLLMKDSHFDLVRLGISLYGVWPSPLTKVSYLQLNANVAGLRPVLSWKTEITTLKKVHAGKYIGYGCTFRANHEMDIAVLPVGYNEGYPRIAGESSAYVLIKGERCPIVGRICMNMMMVDVTHVSKDLSIGDEVVLVGHSGEEVVSAGDVASWSKTIHYELFSKLHPAIPRVVV